MMGFDHPAIEPDFDPLEDFIHPELDSYWIIPIASTKKVRR